MTRLEPLSTEATFSQRAIAAVLDMLIILALAAFLRVACSKMGFHPGSLFFQLLSVSYMVGFAAAQQGQTPGKRFVGLQIVPFAGNDPLGIGGLILRETIGRLVCVLIFGLGYFAVAWRSDRRGWHDLISNTKVIFIGDENAVQSNPLKVLGAAAGVLGVVLTVFAYQALCTPWPLARLARSLELQGYEIDGIGGSWRKGYSIGRIFKYSQIGSTEIKGLRFRVAYDSRAGRPEIVLKNLEIDSAALSLAALSDFKTSRTKKTAAPAPQKTLRVPIDFRVENIDVRDMALSLPANWIGKEDKKITVKRFVASDVVLRSSGKGADIGRLWLESDFLDLDVRNAQIGEKQVALTEPVYAVIKPAMFADYLRVPVEISLAGVLENGKITALKAQAFGKAVRVGCSPDRCELLAEHWWPAQWLKTDLPLSDVALRARAAFAGGLKLDEINAQANWRSARFHTERGMLVCDSGGKRFSLMPAPAAARGAKSKNSDFLAFDRALVLISNDTQNAREALAELLFAKTAAQLPPTALVAIDRDLKYFVNSAGPGLAPALRAPASAGR